MPYKDVKCRILEEELSEFWPQWHVERQISEGASGAVYEIRKEEYGVEFRSALKVLRTADGDALTPAASVLQKDGSGGEGTARNTAIAGNPAIPGNPAVAGWEVSGTKSAWKEETAGKDGLPKDFLNEIKIMETLRGAPNVVTMEDVHYRTDGQSGTLYIRMELLTGLQSFVRNKSFLTVPEIIRIGMDVCKALAFCEEKHIIHRDIKPANLFIDEFGSCKVGDFGVSRRSETVYAANTMTGIGTISYMAPEIYYGKPYNNTVDIYALGLVLYQLLNRGRMPFMPAYPTACTNADIDTSNYKRLHGEEIPQLFFPDHDYGKNEALPAADPAGPGSIDADSARKLDKVIRRACAYHAEDRYRTAAEMSSALDACLHPSDGKDRTALKAPGQREKAGAVSKLPGFSVSAKVFIGAVILAASCMIFLILRSGATRGGTSTVNPTGPEAEAVSQTADNPVPEAEAVSQTVDNPVPEAEAASQTADNPGAEAEVSGQANEKTPSTAWEEVIAASEDGTYKEKYRTGDTLELDLGEEGMITMELAAMDADELADGSGKAHMTWIAKDLLNTEHAMNTTVTNKGGWPVSEMRSWLREDVLPMFPEVVRDNIREVTKYSYSYSDKGTIASADSIWIPSRREIEGAETANENAGAEYTDIYRDDDSRQKRKANSSSLSWWWLRSASGSYGGSFDNFYDSGDVDSNADYEGGVAIGFCL